MKSKKGQISIEFMLIILVCLGYLQLLTVNVLEPAIDAAQDTTRLGQTKLSAEKLASAINEMSSSLGEGKRTLHLFVPKDAELGCNATNVFFDVSLYGGDAIGCSGSSCQKNIPVYANNLVCTNFDNLDSSQFLEIVIEKDSSGIDVS